ncbi:unnamed protein product [Ascophyllum nodosum]
MVLTGQAVATAARAWGNQGLLLVQSKFGTALSRSFFQASTPGSAVYGFPRGVSGVASVDFSTGRLGAGADLRPYRTVAPAVERIVVIGDVHGDIDAFRSCLRMANLVDADDAWAGGETVVVQLGDIFDRGDDDLPIEEWLYRLAMQARRTNGAVYSILGNHEMMNAMGDHSMATRKAFVPFEDLQPELDEFVGGDWSDLDDIPEWARCRLLAMSPGGPVGRLLSAHAVCMKVGDNLFVHGGLLPEHLRSAAEDADQAMENLNKAACSWLLGEAPMPEAIWGENSPVWTRLYSSPESRDVDDVARAQLEEVLRLTRTKRMFVGHTPQRMGINSGANGQVWRVDTGMSAMMGGHPEVLEIKGKEISILTENKSIPASKRVARPQAPKEGSGKARQ